ncbi:alpha beta-hydrolase [Coniophora puteana RWD-64-598 SS2]|uniref:Alpha beta-hydrolase n=1 Tax=Coniophora puteana (strain RWD-64-598) TaxID=741705 RepID=A0A5M3MPH2_CONPW|nr:alpha beta-hydrolase [Coniophora puteana RWD-64-598 SS2]EIW80956.1 alpha beta-hydrolase [Coniophora puteana RWD-64-598 SS2]
MAETPFTISVPDEELARLRAKLELTTLPNEVEGAGWDYGAPLSDIRRLVGKWKNGYDWRKHEAALNAELPQFTRDIAIDGFGSLNIHYVHKKSDCPDAIPLLFVHGWPGSFIEVRKILPLLTETSPEHPSFHVVAFSLPGYGFSEPVLKPGFHGPQYAELGNKLMLSLGYNEYVAQGGDWGYLITRKIAEIYGGKHAKAWHTNFPIASPPSPVWNPLSFLGLITTMYLSGPSQEKANLERAKWFRENGSGYSAEQGTCPQTLGYSLADSPVGLLSWIYEKLHVWTDNYPWTDDEGS